MIPDKVSCSNEKDWRHMAGYQLDRERIVRLLIKAPKNIFSYGLSQYDQKSPHAMSFNVSEVQ